MKNWASIQSRQVEKEGRQFIEEASLESFSTKAKAKKYPAGSVWFWALSAVYGPKQSREDCKNEHRR